MNRVMTFAAWALAAMLGIAAAVLVFAPGPRHGPARRNAATRAFDAAATMPTTAMGTTRPAPGSAERQDERRRMVRDQIAQPLDSREAVTDERTLAALLAAPRHAFVGRSLQDRAYDDTPLPIGQGQTISQPYIVALMTQLLDVKPGQKVLEIGTGSGYQAAVLAHLTSEVYTIEIVRPLAESAGESLKRQGYEHVRCRAGDGYHGWKEHAPFDAIIVTCAAGHLPPPLWEQLKPGGRIVVPVGGPYEVQRLVVMEKQADGTRRSRSITEVRFVPMTGQIERE